MFLWFFVFCTHTFTHIKNLIINKTHSVVYFEAYGKCRPHEVYKLLMLMYTESYINNVLMYRMNRILQYLGMDRIKVTQLSYDFGYFDYNKTSSHALPY